MLIAEAGTLEVEPILGGCQVLSQVIWVTKPGNEHMDFNQTPESVGSKVKTSTWPDLIEENRSPKKSEVFPVEKGSPTPSLSIAESSNDSVNVVEYTSEVKLLTPLPLFLLTL
jgi:hypothetical protein